jgi:hypothetical protein
MREVRHITVAVTPELYLQTRKLAAEMDSTVTAMVAYLLERFPSYLKASGYSVTVPPGVPCHRAPRSTSKAQGPNCQGCGRDAEHPSPSTEKNANSDCTAVKSSQTSNLSATSEAQPRAGTAPVCQYESSNSNITNNLPAEPKTTYSRCTPVWGKWFRRVITSNK